MGRSKAGRIKRVARRPAPVPAPTGEDATPERLRQAGDCHHLGEGTIAKAGERKPLVRRFTDTHIDRMLKRGHISFAQHFAADWYRRIYAEAITSDRVTANYGEGCGGVGSNAYGYPRSERQAAARKTLRAARAVIPSAMVALVEKLIVHDDAPALANGQQRERFGKRVGAALQPLAEWMHAPGRAG